MAFKKYIYFIDFLQRGRERDRELETLMREKHRPAKPVLAQSCPNFYILIVAFKYRIFFDYTVKNSVNSPNRFGSVDRASACGLKGLRFNSGQEHVTWLRAHPY